MKPMVDEFLNPLIPNKKKKANSRLDFFSVIMQYLEYMLRIIHLQTLPTFFSSKRKGRFKVSSLHFALTQKFCEVLCLSIPHENRKPEVFSCFQGV